jgi:hypothetical protein
MKLFIAFLAVASVLACAKAQDRPIRSLTGPLPEDFPQQVAARIFSGRPENVVSVCATLFTPRRVLATVKDEHGKEETKEVDGLYIEWREYGDAGAITLLGRDHAVFLFEKGKLIGRIDYQKARWLEAKPEETDILVSLNRK